jgi:Co/Zn/Cd efflux system component
VLLVGLVTDAALGWAWADPIAALVIAGVAVKEGRNAWRGESCCAPAMPEAADGAAVTDGCADDCCGGFAKGE